MFCRSHGKTSIALCIEIVPLLSMCKLFQDIVLIVRQIVQGLSFNEVSQVTKSLGKASKGSVHKITSKSEHRIHRIEEMCIWRCCI